MATKIIKGSKTLFGTSNVDKNKIILAFKSLFDILELVGNMAPVVKWSRPRIVVPICMGSNPIRRPI